MCWSGTASCLLGLTGTGISYLEFNKAGTERKDILNKHTMRGLMVGYFAIMEFFQVFGYLTLFQTGFLNQLSAYLIYIHISIQPFFILLFPLSMIPKKRRTYWLKIVALFSAVTSVFLLARLIITPHLTECFKHYCTPMSSTKDLTNLHSLTHLTIGCSNQQFLTYQGSWHIAWQWVLNACASFSFLYTITVFILPIFFGAYRTLIYYTLCGPILSLFLTHNPDEWSAIWCLFSVAVMIPIRLRSFESFLTVRHQSWLETVKPLLHKLSLVSSQTR